MKPSRDRETSAVHRRHRTEASEVIERVGVPIVVGGPGLRPTIAQLPGREIALPLRGFELRVKLAVIDLPSPRHQPPAALLDVVGGGGCGHVALPPRLRAGRGGSEILLLGTGPIPGGHVDLPAARIAEANRQKYIDCRDQSAAGEAAS